MYVTKNVLKYQSAGTIICTNYCLLPEKDWNSDIRSSSKYDSILTHMLNDPWNICLTHTQK